jgi:hypothetical protein
MPTSIIRLYDTDGEKLIDSISGEYEDAFSFETFEHIIEAHKNAPLKTPDGDIVSNPVYGDYKLPDNCTQTKKNAIIARIASWDEKRPEKAFYSYYDASQLNRALFRTQKYMGKLLLHRIHVLNPLTNTEIVGDIMYFMVNCQDDEAKEPAGHTTLVKDDDAKGDVMRPRRSTLDKRKNANRQKPKKLSIDVSAFTAKYDIAQNTGSPVKASTTIAVQASPPTSNSKKEKMRMIASPFLENRIKSPFSAIERVLRPTTGGVKNKSNYTLIKSEDAQMLHSAPVLDASKKHQEFETKLAQLALKEKSSAQTPPQRRRSLSLANSPHGGNYKGWVKDLCAKKGELLEVIEQEEAQLKCDPTSPRLDVKESNDVQKDNDAPTTAKVVYYNAHFIGTDTNFLDSPEIRGIFARNCLDLSELGILEMPEVTGFNEDAMAQFGTPLHGHRNWIVTFSIYFMVIVAIALFSIVIYHQVSKVKG